MIVPGNPGLAQLKVYSLRFPGRPSSPQLTPAAASHQPSRPTARALLHSPAVNRFVHRPTIGNPAAGIQQNADRVGSTDSQLDAIHRARLRTDFSAPTVLETSMSPSCPSAWAWATPPAPSSWSLSRSLSSGLLRGIRQLRDLQPVIQLEGSRIQVVERRETDNGRRG